jgi:hypothetical protein
LLEQVLGRLELLRLQSLRLLAWHLLEAKETKTNV